MTDLIIDLFLFFVGFCCGMFAFELVLQLAYKKGIVEYHGIRNKND